MTKTKIVRQVLIPDEGFVSQSIQSRQTRLYLLHSPRNLCGLCEKGFRVVNGMKQPDTDMRRLTTGILSEKRVVRRFRRCANVVECTYANLDSIAYYRFASL